MSISYEQKMELLDAWRSIGENDANPPSPQIDSLFHKLLEEASGVSGKGNPVRIICGRESFIDYWLGMNPDVEVIDIKLTMGQWEDGEFIMVIYREHQKKKKLKRRKGK